MTTENEINEQINRDVDAYNHKIYDGFIPTGFMDKFKKALMVTPVGTHQFNMDFIKRLIAKREDEVTVIEVGMIINLLFLTPPHMIFDSLEEYIDTIIEFSKLSDEYNKKNKEFENKIIMKRERLLKLSGVINSTPMKNGLGIVGKA